MTTTAKDVLEELEQITEELEQITNNRNPRTAIDVAVWVALRLPILREALLALQWIESGKDEHDDYEEDMK